MSLRLMPISSMPWPEKTSSIGPACACDVELDHPLVELARRAAGPAACRGWRRARRRATTSSSVPLENGLAGPARQQEVEQPLLGQRSRPARAPPPPSRLLTMLTAELGEVADHRLDVAADVADLGVLGGLDLEERRLGEPGEPAGDLRLPDPGGADHDDVLRRDLVAQLRRQVLAPPAVAQRDGHRALGALLADDVAVQLGDDLGRRERGSGRHRTSTVMWSLV